MSINLEFVQNNNVSIQEHLEHLQFNFETFKFETTSNFWAINVDTFLTSIIIGVIFLIFFIHIAKKARVKNPSKLQIFAELIIEFIDNLIKDSFGNSIKTKNDRIIAPLSLTIFIWVFLLNFMDLLPVDLISSILSIFGVSKFRSVATGDANLTFALSISVFFLCIFYNIFYKGAKGYLKEIFFSPFSPKWLMFPVNFAFRMLIDIVKPISLSLRLYGNIFAGEIVFILISMAPWWAQWTFGSIWAIFHILIILIQAFIFMMLTIIYISMSTQEH